MGQNGAKSCLINNLVSGSVKDATLTVNNDKTFSFVGTTSGSGSLNICGENNGTEDVLGLPKGEYVLASDSTGLNSNTFLQVIGKDGNGNVTINAIVNSDGKKYTSFTVNEGDFVYWVRLAFPSGAVNVSAKAMICPKAWYDIDPTYQPYSETNQQLTSKTTGLWDNMMDNGAVNMCPNNATSKTDNEVTWTVNADKTVTAVVASTVVTAKELTLYINDDGSPNLVGKRVRLTGCPSGGSENTYRVHVARAESTDGSTGTPIDYGNGIEFTWLNNGSGTKAAVRIKIIEGCPAGTYVFKPMLSDPALNLSYDDYVPYAMTNRELTEDVKVLQSTNLGVPRKKLFRITGGSTSIKASIPTAGLSSYAIFGIKIMGFNDPDYFDAHIMGQLGSGNASVLRTTVYNLNSSSNVTASSAVNDGVLTITISGLKNNAFCNLEYFAQQSNFATTEQQDWTFVLA